MNPVSKLMHYDNPSTSDIPNISLYMDQLLEYFESTLGELKRQDEDAVLTKTMINNYVKAGLIKAPDKKKYDRESISDLIIIYHLKKAFSIQDTMQLLKTMKQSQEYYEPFIDGQKSVREQISNSIASDLENMSVEEVVKLLQTLTHEITVKKQLSETLIDYLSSKISVK